MIEGRRSATAERVAMRRAAHQLLDRPLIFEDPLALAILSDEATARVRAGGTEEHTAVAQGFRLYMATRSRFAEDELAFAVRRGVGQYVILGAGLDTFAYRNPFPELAVFEVDHPATQAWKRERLQHGGIAIPDSLFFAPVDFERDTLAHGLEAVGFSREKPAFFSWLGVVPYLTREAAFATLTFIAALPRGSAVVFDYAILPEMMDERERKAHDFLAQRVALAGEPFRLFFDPAQLEIELRAMGFREVEDRSSAAIRAGWLSQDPPRHGRAGRLVCARL